MKYSFCSVLIPFLMASCNFNADNKAKQAEEAKAKLDSIVQTQLAEIDMNEVDSYPLFPQCSDTLIQEEQKKCFENTFAKIFQDIFQNEKFEVAEPINDTLKVFVKISNQGNTILDYIEAKDQTKNLLPNLETSLKKHFEAFPNIKPAVKQGVEVSTQFTLPIVIDVK